MSAVVADLLTGGVEYGSIVLVASSGELASQRAGVLNLSVEGMMLSGAFGAAVAAHGTGSPIVGVAVAVVAGVVLASVQALLSVTLRANQLITGITLNALALGLTSFGARLIGSGSLETVPAFGKGGIPGLRELPVVGPALFGQPWLLYLGLVLVAVLGWATRRGSRWGLMIDAAGEDPGVADKAGVDVVRLRGLMILVTGAAAGFAGAMLALADLAGFTENMTAGIGYIAVVAVIAAAWRASWLVLVCLVFGVAQALQFTAAAIGLHVPVALLVMSPYVIALAAIGGLVGSNRGPSGLTIPWARVR